MELKAGYKQTEVGVIPENWDVARFDDVFKRENSKKHQLTTIQYQEVGNLPVVDQGQDHIVGFTDREELRFSVPKGGAIVFGDHTCIVKYIDFDFAVGADGTQVLVGKPGQSARFHAYDLERRAIQSTGYNRHFKLLKERAFTSPPNVEQSAIATVLSDVDALLAAQDALIAKKRAIKEGAIQELLTGKRRLPGFSGEWEVKRLGDLGQTYGGLVGKSKKDFGQGSAQYVPFVNVIANTVVDVNALDKVDVSPDESQNRVLKGDFLFNGSSETPEEVALCALVIDEVNNLYLNSFCFGFRLKEGVRIISLFLAYYMRSQVGRDLIKSLAQGSTRYNLSKSAFLDGGLKLPSAKEQAAIVEVLSDMDTEITAFETQRAKTAQLKQGMMQALLTGRIRLV